MGRHSIGDLDARRRLAEAANPPTELTRDQRRFAVTWLGDMLTAERNSLGVIRLGLALAVLISHAVFLATGKAELEPLYRWTGYTLGQHAVQVFFILSGILVAQSLFQSRSVRDYAIARGLRIFPALAVCVLLTALVLGPWLSELPAWLYLRDSWTAAYIIKTIGLWTGSAELPGLFQDNVVPRAVNTSVWTLKYEVLCYVIFAGAGVLVLKAQAWRATAAALIAIWLIAAFAVPAGISALDGPKSMLHVLHYFTIFFGTGVVAYAARRYIPVHGALLVPLAALLWFAIGTRFAVPAMSIALGYGALWLATFRFGGLRAFTNRNDYSYATYLYHMPVAQAALALVPGMHVAPLIGFTAGFVLLLAYLSWELIERPALGLRKTFRRVEAVSAVEKPDAVVAPPRPSLDIAKVWRPMTTRRTLSIVPDVTRPEVIDAKAAIAPTPSIPKSRLTLVTQRHAPA